MSSNHMLELSEQVNVWAFFQKSEVTPYVFFWRGRRIKIDKINLMHTKKEAGVLHYIYSVSSAGNFYRLRFDLTSLKWVLEEVEEE